MNVTITNLQIATLSSIVTETEVKRPASKDAAIKRFTTVLVEKIGERANDLIETILEATSFEEAKEKLAASFVESVVEEVIEEPVIVVEPVAEKAVRKPRAPDYTFDAKEVITPATKVDSLRNRVIALLLDGGTYSEVRELIIENDKKTNKPHDNLERRTHRTICSMHTGNGYGMTYDSETGIIRLVK